MTSLNGVLSAVADHLWVERDAVQQLLFRLVSAKLLLAADERRFVDDAVYEVEAAIEELRGHERGRHAVLAPLAYLWNVPVAQLTLAELATRSPAPFDDVFADHLDVFESLATEIDRTAARNRQLAAANLQVVGRAIELFTGAPATPAYSASGRVAAAPAPATRVDQVL